MSGGCGFLDAPPALSILEQPPVARSIGWSWALSPRRRSFGCGQRLLHRHGMDKQSWPASLLRASGAHRGRAAPGRLTLPDGRGLSTPDTAASAVVYGSLSDAWCGSYAVHHGGCRRVVERNGVRSQRFIARRHHTISFAPFQVLSSSSLLRSDRANQRHRTRPPHLPSRSVGGGVEAKSSPSSGEPCLAPSQQPPLLFRSAVQVTSSRSLLRSDRANQRHRTRPPHLPSRSVGGGAEAKSSPSRGAQLPVFHTNALSCMTAVPRTGDLCLARGHSSGRPWPLATPRPPRLRGRVGPP